MDFKPEDLGIRRRCFPDKNYSAIYYNYKTMRIPLDKTKPVLELDYPEFLDIKVTGKCSGKCRYCYQDSTSNEDHYPNVVQKIKDFFGPMDMNQRPFQVAIGGGNPNEHPDFIEVLETFHDLGITPNYTTNGIGMDSAEILKVTKELCGGVAITCHPHLEDDWKLATELCITSEIRTNFHILISSDEDIELFKWLFSIYSDSIEYFVLLPLLPQGRAIGMSYDMERVLRGTVKVVEGMDKKSQVAFGANFWPYIKDNRKLGLSLYEPEMFSAYIDFKNDSPMIYKSSFSDEIRKIG